MSLRHHLRRSACVEPAEAFRLVFSGVLLLDVRRARDFSRHHVPGAVNVPLAELSGRAAELPDDRLLLTFCVGGLLSSGAANLLVEWGFDALSVSRGLIGWRAAGLPLEGVFRTGEG